MAKANKGEDNEGEAHADKPAAGMSTQTTLTSILDSSSSFRNELDLTIQKSIAQVQQANAICRRCTVLLAKRKSVRQDHLSSVGRPATHSSQAAASEEKIRMKLAKSIKLLCLEPQAARSGAPPSLQGAWSWSPRRGCTTSLCCCWTSTACTPPSSRSTTSALPPSLSLRMAACQPSPPLGAHQLT